eukprot:1065727-Rhodomonas_salina.2
MLLWNVWYQCEVCCYQEGERRGLIWLVATSICLRMCYAVSSTDVASVAVCLRVRHAMSDTDKAHGAVCLRMCYKISGTDIAWQGICNTSGWSTAREVLPQPIALRTSCGTDVTGTRYGNGIDAAYHPTHSLCYLPYWSDLVSYAIVWY